MSVLTKQTNTQLQQVDKNLLPVTLTPHLAPGIAAPKRDVFA